MKKHIKTIATRMENNPAFQKSLQSLKPNKSVWGILGVLLFFIAPEIAGFFWGEELTTWAHTGTVTEATESGRHLYWIVEKLFEDGGSWINLSLGVLLLVWLFRD